MQYNFDEIIIRKGTHCVKHDALLSNFGSDDLLPMWVADNDWRSPDFVMDAIRERCNHEVLGYATASSGYYTAVMQWLSSRYHVDAEQRHLHFVPGIVAGISYALQALTQPGDGVMITTPVYPPFIHLPQGGGRKLITSPLSEKNGRFAIDFEDFEHKIESCKMLILSNPHNPAGTVWSADELRRIAHVCHENGVVVISDEIHADMVLPQAPLRHTSFSTASAEAASCSITFTAPSKTFNIAGLGSSIAYVPDETLRGKFFGYMDTYEVANGNIFAFVGAEAAYSKGTEWLSQMLEYLQGNVGFLKDYTQEHMPKLRVMLPEASYLAWLDFSAYGLSHQEVKRRLLEDAKVALNDGTTFSPLADDPATRCRFRLNIGCPRAVLEEALNRITVLFEDN